MKMTDGLQIVGREERVKDYILPLAIVEKSGDWANLDSLYTPKDGQIALEEPDVITLQGSGFIILDFGKEIHGGLRILTHSISGDSSVRIRFGESVSETCVDVISSAGDGNSATNDHSIRDFNHTLVTLSDMQMGSTGFRFVRIDFSSDTINIKNIFGVFEHRELTRLGSFECDDVLVNKIFDVAGYTTELCMQNMLWDGIKRDRLVWIGDTHPEMMTIVSLFGSDKCIEEALEFCANHAPLPNWINCIPSYSFWWLCILADYYLHNKNTDFVIGQKAYIVGLVDIIDNLVDKSGKLNFPSDNVMGFFLDWPSCTFPEKQAGVYALCAYTLSKTKVLFEALNLQTAKIDAIISRLDKSIDAGKFKQVSAFKVLGGHADAQKLLPVLLEGGADGMSTFMSYYILSAIAKGGKTQDAIDLMKEYYGAMLELGATTFWEDFSLEWLKNASPITRLPKTGEVDIHKEYGDFCYKGYRHSLCHGWSSGPVPFLMHSVVGVTELEAGCKKIKITPNLGGLKWVKASYPTPFGNLIIYVTNQNGKLKTEYTAPKEIEVLL